MIDIPLRELLKLWGELVEAYHGKNGFGGDTAELYAYRFNRDNPVRRAAADTSLAKDAAREAAMEAKTSLWELCRLFREEWQADIYVDDQTLWNWFQTAGGFDHRAHVQVLPRDNDRRFEELKDQVYRRK